jgi:hypothetical protein
MDKVNFSDNQKLIKEDLNPLHDLTEDGLADLVRSLTGGQETVLFKDAIHSAVHLAPNIKITVPEQWFAVNGIPEKIAASNIIKPETDDYHRIFFVLSRTNQSADRDFVQTSPSIQVVTNGTVIRKLTAGRIEVTSSGSSGTPPGTPTLNPTDIGFVELGSVIWDQLLNRPQHLGHLQLPRSRIIRHDARTSAPSRRCGRDPSVRNGRSSFRQYGRDHACRFPRLGEGIDPGHLDLCAVEVPSQGDERKQRPGGSEDGGAAGGDQRIAEAVRRQR